MKQDKKYRSKEELEGTWWNRIFKCMHAWVHAHYYSNWSVAINGFFAVELSINKTRFKNEMLSNVTYCPVLLDHPPFDGMRGAKISVEGFLQRSKLVGQWISIC